MDFKDQKVATPFGDVAIRTWGTGTPVVALHGWLDNLESFTKLAPLLSNIQLIAVDFPGHGESYHLAGPAYHFPDVILFIEMLLDALKLQKCHLLGHSMGAAAASLYCAVRPERVVKCALIEGLGPLVMNPEDGPQRFKNFLDHFKNLQEKPETRYSSVDGVVQQRLKITKMKPESAHLILSRSLRQEGGFFRWKSDRRLTIPNATRMVEDQVLAFLAKIDCPVLLVRATDGLLHDVGLMQKRQSVVKKMKSVDVQGQHHVHVDYPEVVAPALNEFFGS